MPVRSLPLLYDIASSDRPVDLSVDLRDAMGDRLLLSKSLSRDGVSGHSSIPLDNADDNTF